MLNDHLVIVMIFPRWSCELVQQMAERDARRFPAYWVMAVIFRSFDRLVRPHAD
ncbi:hypothetical protein PO124_22310 [Bacillus licheniformis]|nr:hypothetical protein [Bacillus licheniformis]